MTVSTENQIQIGFEWFEGRRFQVWGEREDRRRPNIIALKNALFGWHEKSFYGTLLQLDESNHFILLDPNLALDFFANPQPLQHANLNLAENLQFQWLTEAASFLKEALTAGRFAPDMHKWLDGQPGWKLLLTSEQEAQIRRLTQVSEQFLVPSMEEWFDLTMGQLIIDDPAISAAYGELIKAHPIEGNVLADRSLRPDEEDWLISIGWKKDTVPFTVALQLLEPDGEVEPSAYLEDPDHDTPLDDLSDDHSQWRLQIVLQDKENSDIIVECSLQGEPLTDDFPDAWKAHVIDRITKQAKQWMRIVPELEDTTRHEQMVTFLSDEQAWQFLTEGSLRLAEAGCFVLLPSWWDTAKNLKPRLKAQVKSSVGSNAEPMFGLQQIVAFDWKVALGDLNLTEEEFHKLTDQKKRFYYIRGQWIQLDPEYLQQIQKKMKQMKKNGLSFGEVLENHLSASDSDHRSVDDDGAEILRDLKMEIEINENLERLLIKLQETKNLTIISPPEAFQGQLRSYQLQGASWMIFLHQYGLGGCLADDMGLGKTIQWITYLLHLKQSRALSKPALLICPTSVLGNWQKELERFAPSLQIHLHYGADRGKGEDFQKSIQGADLVITSYTLSYLDEEELSSVHWGPLCLDEAQNIKNAYTKQSAAIRKLNTDHRIALTGTPIENRLTELWSIFDFMNPGFLGALAAFKKKYVNPIEKSSDSELVSQVQHIVQPFLLRRMKKDPNIQLDLPDKNEAKTYVSLTAEQGTLYESILQNLFDKIDRLPPMERRGLILATLTRLKQACNHPSLTLKERKGLQKAEQSNKIIRLLEMVQELRDEGDRCLIFTQFVEMGYLIQSLIEHQLGEPALFLHGGVAKSKRDQMIEQFQDRSLPAEQQRGIFVLSLKAGGTGLNLTAANHVFHIDRWWNPAVENQATDRAFRIGQQRDVQVYKFITLGTLEERIDEMIERKQSLSEQIVGGGNQWVTEMSTSELRDVFSLRREWIE